ncbi:Lovastatin diketide synthase LovF [Daldinia childiae]|uniref:Lovastatin diketide synthase LovF n=1 Tax=Daldinia childiae TaxID=326645 RepID=UPI001447C2A7|nr:Lovastatin diketide synthase LovF [Daldinia childiae]KAF3058249.1 Lovastatin diketide synthase LovF [Daldinia childiae]
MLSCQWLSLGYRALSCDAENPQKLWDMISQGRSAASRIPPDRFNIDAFYHPSTERHGTMNFKEAHFMKRDISAFDAPFFKIPVSEAKAMDPQQRMALECTYEALENAGIRMEDVAGSDTSVYVGTFTKDYNDMLSHDRDNVPTYQATGTGLAMMSNRVSWFFDMRGPSISVDTACSSSMAALHLGCQSLRTGESKLVRKSHSFDHKADGYSRGEGAGFCILKPLHLAIRDNDVIRGVIRNSGINQDGNTPGITLPSEEAQETLIRKVYADAGLSLVDTTYVEAHGTGTAAGDPVEASALSATFGKARPPGEPLLIGSIKSNIGHLEGGSGLVQVIKGIMMLEKGEIVPTIWYEKPNPRIPMEDWNLAIPTELMPWPKDGLRRISINSFGYGGTNGHCIIDDAYHYLKTRGLSGNHNVQVLNGSSPASSPDSGIDTAHDVDMMSQLSDRTKQWRSLEGLLGGRFESSLSPIPKLLVWSSHEQAGISRITNEYGAYLDAKLKGASTEAIEENHDKNLLCRLARTLAGRRSILPWKSFIIATSCKEASTELRKPLRSVRSNNTKTVLSLAFVFTGQGAQWYAMGRELLALPVFRESLEGAGRYFVQLGAPWSLMTEIWKDESTSRLDSPDLSQPICTALQVALVDLLRMWNIFPTAVVGHSSGEIAAAYAKGALTRDDAWAIAYHRGHLSNCIQGFAPQLQGSMLAVGLGYKDAREYIARVTEGEATIACINSPSSVTLSGDSVAITQLEKVLKDDGHFARKLKVDVAYHSPHMQVIADRYYRAISKITLLPEGQSTVKMFSSLTGNLAKNSELGPSYWVANMVGQVNFTGAVESMLTYSGEKSRRRAEKGFVRNFIELGPHSALKGPLNQILSHDTLKSYSTGYTYQSVIIRGSNACETAFTVAGKLYQSGYPVDINAVNEQNPSDDFLVDLPPFSWNHSAKYWTESLLSKAHRFRDSPRKDLLGLATLEHLVNEPRFRNILRVTEVPWIEQHKVQGSILYPAGMMVMVIEAVFHNATKDREIDNYELRDIIISKAIVIPNDENGVETMLSIKPHRTGSRALTSTWQEFQVYSRQEAWELNCSGLIRINYKEASNAFFHDEAVLLAADHAEQYHRIQENHSRTKNSRQFYEHLDSIGLQYGPIFRNLIEIKKGNFWSVCKLKIPDTKSLMPHNFEYPHIIHPATLDSMIHMALPSYTKMNEDITSAMVPTGICRLIVSADVPNRPGVVLSGYSQRNKLDSGDDEWSIFVADTQWDKSLVTFEGIKCAVVHDDNEGDIASAQYLRKLATVFEWKPDISLLDRQQIENISINAAKQVVNPHRKILEELEIASLIYIKRIVNELSLPEVEGLGWNLKLFYNYMHKRYDMDLGEKAESELLDRVSKSSSDGAILCAHGEHLPLIFRGQIPPLQVLMNNDLLHNWYKYSLGTERHNCQMTAYIQLLAHKNPNMNILEVGGGTGGVSFPILESLGGSHDTSPHFTKYTFTDITTGYFEKAIEKLAPWTPFMEFRNLNIEQDPASQGFKEYSYDLIVASNVLHATRSLSQTLKHVHKLLKPNGKLILREITEPAGKMRTHMIVGSLEGWWYGEGDGRHEGPYLTVDKWNYLMLDVGFSGVEINFPDFEEKIDLTNSVMVTTASAPKPLDTSQEVMIVLPTTPEQETSNFAENIASQLRDARRDVITVKLQNTIGINVKNKSCLILVDVKKHEGFLLNVSTEDWNALKHLLFSSRSATYVTRGGTVDSENPQSNLMTGLSRVIRSENSTISLSTLDLDPNVAMNTDETIATVIKVFTTFMNSKDLERPDWEVAIRDGVPMIQRIVLEKGVNDLIKTLHVAARSEPVPFKQEGRPLTLQIESPGRLDTLRFVDDPTASAPLSDYEVEIEIKSAGLNFKDVMIAMDQLSQHELGLDASGIVSRVGYKVKSFRPGDKVMTWKKGTFRNYIRTDESMVQLIPPNFDFNVAASIPLVYSTAYYALVNVGNVQKGETILIHSAAGGFGQASIALAQHFGAEVFATVSSREKKQLLINTYNVPEDHIFNSRDASFAQAVKRHTGGRGVDVLLNSLAGDALRESWHCVARFGRFIELGQKDIVGNTGLDMAPFIKNMSFHSVNMIDLMDHDILTTARVFREVMGLIRAGIVKPATPITTMPFSRLVIEAVDGDIIQAIPPGTAPVCFHPDATYVIVGGTGGLGGSIANWMAESGAKNILLLSRSGANKASVPSLLTRLTGQGVKADAWACDIADESQLLGCLDRCRIENWPAIRGVIQGAMVLRDGISQTMSSEQFLAATRSKVQGSWNLHSYLPNDLDFFVMLSSIAGVGGSRGQGNYAAGNTYQDALAHHRRKLGLNACAIDVGMVLGVGFLAEETTDDRVFENMQSWIVIGILEKEFLSILQAAITGESFNGARMPPQVITGLGTGGILLHGAKEEPYYYKDAKFAHLGEVDIHQLAKVTHEDTVQLRVQLTQASSLEQATDVVTNALVKKLAKSMMIAAEDIEVTRPVSSYGVDSLLAVELRAWIYSELQSDISVFDLLSKTALTSLATKIASGSKAIPDTVRAEE